MGYYINTPETNAARGRKAQVILSTPDAHAHVVSVADVERDGLNLPGADQVLVCVVQNAYFDAALVVQDARDVKDILNPNDARSRIYLLVDKAWAHRWSGITKAVYE